VQLACERYSASFWIHRPFRAPPHPLSTSTGAAQHSAALHCQSVRGVQKRAGRQISKPCADRALSVVSPRAACRNNRGGLGAQARGSRDAHQPWRLRGRMPRSRTLCARTSWRVLATGGRSAASNTALPPSPNQSWQVKSASARRARLLLPRRWELVHGSQSSGKGAQGCGCRAPVLNFRIVADDRASWAENATAEAPGRAHACVTHQGGQGGQLVWFESKWWVVGRGRWCGE